MLGKKVATKERELDRVFNTLKSTGFKTKNCLLDPVISKGVAISNLAEKMDLETKKASKIADLKEKISTYELAINNARVGFEPMFNKSGIMSTNQPVAAQVTERAKQVANSNLKINDLKEQLKTAESGSVKTPNPHMFRLGIRTKAQEESAPVVTKQAPVSRYGRRRDPMPKYPTLHSIQKGIEIEGAKKKNYEAMDPSVGHGYLDI